MSTEKTLFPCAFGWRPVAGQEVTGLLDEIERECRPIHFLSILARMKYTNDGVVDEPSSTER